MSTNFICTNCGVPFSTANSLHRHSIHVKTCAKFFDKSSGGRIRYPGSGGWYGSSGTPRSKFLLRKKYYCS